MSNPRPTKKAVAALARAQARVDELAAYLEGLPADGREQFGAMVAAADALDRIAFLTDARKRKMALLALAIKRST